MLRLGISQRAIAFAFVLDHKSPHRRPRVEADPLNGSGQSEELQDANTPPIEINLVPLQSMTSGSRMGVMIVMPAFAKGEQRHPPTVARILAGIKASTSPHVRRRVDQPSGVQRQRYAQEDSPQQNVPTAKQEQRHAD